MTSSTPTSLELQVAQAAQTAISATTESHYTHRILINASLGIYNCDCSGFVEHVLDVVAKRHVTPIQNRRPNGKRPLAKEFYEFFDSLDAGDSSSSTTGKGWIKVAKLTEARRGDIVNWLLGGNQTGDTGHIVIVSANPVPVDVGGWSYIDGDARELNLATYGGGEMGNYGRKVLAVPVYDASCVPHFDDDRGEGVDFSDGIGSGMIHFQVNEETGRAVSFKFNERASWHHVPIVVARIVGFAEN